MERFTDFLARLTTSLSDMLPVLTRHTHFSLITGHSDPLPAHANGGQELGNTAVISGKPLLCPMGTLVPP